MGAISDRVIEHAGAYIGKTETKPNRAPWLDELMAAAYNPAGWKPGEPYCIASLLALFEIACIEADVKFPLPYSKNTQEFYNQAAKNGYVSQKPTVGDILIFEIGNSGHGHAELVIGTGQLGVTTIGFNTSASVTGSQHNGEGVYQKLRRFKDFPKTGAAKLWIRGYVTTSKI